LVFEFEDEISHRGIIAALSTDRCTGVDGSIFHLRQEGNDRAWGIVQQLIELKIVGVL